MSVNKGKDVAKLVEKYRRDFPGLERRFLRRLIRSENKIKNASELKKLDRYLAKVFPKEPKKSSTEKPSQQLNEWEFERWLILHKEEKFQDLVKGLTEHEKPEKDLLKEFVEHVLKARKT